MVHGTGGVPDEVHDPWPQDQQEVPQPFCTDHGADQPVPSDGAEASQEGGADGGQQCPQVGWGPPQGQSGPLVMKTSEYSQSMGTSESCYEELRLDLCGIQSWLMSPQL